MDREQATRILEEADRTKELVGSKETERLAVLATFNPSRLADGDGPDILRLLCDRLAPRDDLDEAILTERYRIEALTTMLRRDGLAELRRLRRIVNADYETPLQHVLDAFIADGDLPHDLSEENDLLAALEVRRWMSAALAQAGSDRWVTPSRDELESRLTLLNVTRPVRRLVAGGFVGREAELRRLHDYRMSPGPPSLADNPAMVVYGIGGIGKSTLVARFVLDLAELSDPDDQSVWAYIDLDRPTLASGDPTAVVTDIIEQVSAQLPTESRTLRRFLETASMLVKGSGIESFDQTLSARARADRLAEALRAIKVSSLVVVVDTFEELERRNPERAKELHGVFATLAATLPAFRLVVSGRAPARTFVSPSRRSDRLLEVGPLTEDAAVRLLRHFVDQSPSASGTDVSETLAREVISLVGGIPLTLRLAATVLVREGPRAITDAASRARALDQVRSEFVRGFLYQRILDHITVPDPGRTAVLRKVARAGLALRWITPELIDRVLIPSIELTPAPDGKGLFDDLASEVAFAERDGDLLRLREELRGPALAALGLDDPLMIEHVHQAAANYFAYSRSSEAWAEFAYHRLALGQDVFGLDAEALRRLEPSISDFPATSAALIQRAIAEPRALTASHQLAVWEQKTLSEADAALRAERFDEVEELLSRRSDRTEGSELHRVESRLWEARGDLDAATDAARRDLAAATAAADPTRLAAAAVWLAGLLERTDHAVEAAAGLQATADTLLLAGRPEVRLELLLNRMTLMERTGILSVKDRWTSGLRVRALLQRAGPARLSTDTAIVRLCGAALGREEPDRLRAAALAVGLGYEEDSPRVASLIAEIASWDAAQPEPGSLSRALDLRTSQPWTVLVGLGTDAGPLLDRLWATATPPESVREALRTIYVWWGIPSEPAEASAEPSEAFPIEIPIDWSRPETKELEDILATAYPRSGDIMELAARSGIDTATINWSSPNRIATRELLNQAVLTDNLDAVIETTANDRAAISVYPRIAALMGEAWVREHDITKPPDR